MAMNEKAEKYYLNGKKCFDNEDFEGAVDYFTKAIELMPNDKTIYENRGIAYFYIENYLKAIEDYTTAIELGENDKSIYKNRGIAYLRA